MTRSYTKQTKESLSTVVALSTSFTEVCRTLDRKPVGGAITHIKLMCDRWEIDYSHMTGQSWKKGQPALNRKSPADRLVIGKPTDHRVGADRLRRSMLEVGIEYKCNCCGLVDWQGVQLTLEIDHIDECYWNNTQENLQFLCPNCHSQKTKMRM